MKGKRPKGADRNLPIIGGITLLSVMGIASVAPAFPEAARAFSVSAQEIALLISAFTLPGILFTPLTGILADRIGRREILAPSLLLFGLAGTGCAFVSDFHHLLLLRFLQGLGASCLSSLNMVLIGDLYRGPERETITGYNSSAVSIGTALFPALGGALALLGWRGPFLLSVMAFPVAFAVFFHLDVPFEKKDMTLKSYFNALGRGLRRREVIAVLMATTGTFIVLFGSVSAFLPFLLADRFGASSLEIGLVFVCQSLATALAASQSGHLGRRFSPRQRLVSAFSLFALALFLYPRAESLPAVFVAALLFGLGQGLNMPVLLSLIASFACPDYRGGLLAVNTMALKFAQTIAPLLAGLVLARWGLESVFYASALTALVTLAAVLICFGRSSLDGHC